MRLNLSFLIYPLAFGLLLGVSGCQDIGTVNVSGVLLESCDNPTPLAGVEVHWGAAGNSIYSCITDSTGAFSISGNYKVRYSQSSLGFGLWLEGEMPFYFNQLLGQAEDPGYVGNVYRENWLSYILKVQVDDPSVWSTSDTLYFGSYAIGMDSALTFVGPFVDGQILDTLKLRSASHIGYPTDEYISFGLPFTINGGEEGVARYDWQFGMSNDVCGKFLELTAELKK